MRPRRRATDPLVFPVALPRAIVPPFPAPAVLRASFLAWPSASLSTRAPVDPADVDELVRRARTGDRGAFAELYRMHREAVARLVFRMLGRASDIEDVVQEVFLQVHRSLGDFRGQSKFSTWIHRITVNVVLMIRRAERSRPVFADEPLAPEHERDRGLLPDEEATLRRRLVAFKRLLDRISEKKRTVYVLHDIEGMAPAEIATIVDAPVLTVRTRLFYARRELAELMREEPALAQLVDEIAGLGAQLGAPERSPRSSARLEGKTT
ncbi:sigma-70 family RNA polymerase sigma factor [Polyangium spumosum]|uniref:Sigma-70 family RNA polymerase sigma factor n=1 Tax=Polyangium spumosum TaxID=889282 RepID=A0A6N7PYH1_9BACT|nr:sigma-70 family RNA polymerase sigma factor [Polyangium spumosum]